MNTSQLTAAIKARGYDLGFDLIGMSKATELTKEGKDLESWLKKGFHGEMQYMENYFDMRIDPRRLVEGAKTVISVIHNYYPEASDTTDKTKPKISRYAWGPDYHKVLKKKLYELFAYIQEEVGSEVSGRVFVDSAPVMDKAWAQKSGLGWIGKHTNLISPRRGSYFFIGEIILDLELEPDGPIKDFCGTCTRCLDACPTDALKPYQIDASKCISYLNIELKADMPESWASKTEGWLYGCDICQEVCPWNRFSKPFTGDSFKPLSHMDLSTTEWEELDEKSYKKLVRKTAMSRIKWRKMMHNLKIWRLYTQAGSSSKA